MMKKWRSHCKNLVDGHQMQQTCNKLGATFLIIKPNTSSHTFTNQGFAHLFYINGQITTFASWPATSHACMFIVTSHHQNKGHRSSIIHKLLFPLRFIVPCNNRCGCNPNGCGFCMCFFWRCSPPPCSNVCCRCLASVWLKLDELNCVSAYCF